MLTKEMREMLYNPDAYFAKLHAKIERTKVRNIWWRLSPAEKIYCQLRSATANDREAFVAAFPTERNIGWTAMKKRIYRLNCSRKVQRYTKTLDEAFATETVGKYIDLKERMIGKVLESIDRRTATDPTEIRHCRMEMYMLSRMMGWMPSPECSTDDARHSPQAKTDEELNRRPMSARMKRLSRMILQAQADGKPTQCELLRPSLK